MPVNKLGQHGTGGRHMEEGTAEDAFQETHHSTRLCDFITGHLSPGGSSLTL